MFKYWKYLSWDGRFAAYAPLWLVEFVLRRFSFALSDSWRWALEDRLFPEPPDVEHPQYYEEW